VFVSSSVFNTMLMPFKEKLAVLLDSFDLATQDPQRFNQKLLDFASGLDKDEISYLLSLKPDELKNFLQSLDRILNGLSNFLILSDEDLAYLASSKLEKITFFKPDSNSEVVYNVNLLFSLKQAKDKLFTLIQDECKDRKKDAAIAQKLLTAFIRPTIERNQAMTDEKVNAAIKALPLQVKMEEVKKDEIIVSKGERLNKETVQKLLVLFKKQEKLQFYSFLTGNILFLLLVLLVGVFFIRRELPRLYENNHYFYLILAQLLLVGVIIKITTLFPVSYYILPVSAAGILTAVLLDIDAAVFIAVMAQAFVGIFFGFDVKLMSLALIGCLIGSYAAKGASKRIHLLKAGFLIGLSNFSVIVAFGLIDNLGTRDIIANGFIRLAGGLVAWIIAPALLPILESLFTVATNIKLLELSDLNHPLLKRMSLEAPGTYHHSIIVGNLAEVACEAIGANPLLARVGAYFHDVGKLKNPEYFSENQESQEDEQKHEKLSPTMSSLIIINHVKEGVEFAKKYKLPQAIIDILNQHHGTGLIFYFYQRALEKVEDENMIKEERFRYPGPRPNTKEAGAVLLADSVEAACRAVKNPNVTKIQDTVRRVINNKFIDRQLDLCDLTIADLEKIAQIYTRVLTGLYHSRVEYPALKKDAD